MRTPRFGTFSIVAHDPETGAWGVAVQSKFIAVGAVVPFVEAGAGAVATQALANTAYGPDGLALLRKGVSADEVVRRLTSADNGRDERQLGVVDARGGAASFTGTKCNAWAGHEVGNGFACQGNILVGPAVVHSRPRAATSSTGCSRHSRPASGRGATAAGCNPRPSSSRRRGAATGARATAG